MKVTVYSNLNDLTLEAGHVLYEVSTLDESKAGGWALVSKGKQYVFPNTVILCMEEEDQK